MTLKLSIIRRILVVLAALWFVGYASATTICANTCPDCVAVSVGVNSCSASCSAVSVTSHDAPKIKFTKLTVFYPTFHWTYAFVNINHIWKPPKQALSSSLTFMI